MVDGDDEDNHPEDGEHIALIDTMVLAELREGQALVVEERDGEKGESPEREDVPVMDVSASLDMERGGKRKADVNRKA